jgi:hypothetical protein
MVRETQMNEGNGKSTGPSPERVAARSFRELLGDVMTLGELQMQLFRIDWEQCKARAVVPLVTLAIGAVLLLSCVPVALVCLALFIEEFTRLTPAASFLVALGVGMILGGVLALGAAMYLRNSFAMFKRSQSELDQNYRWVKTMLGRAGTAPFRSQEDDRFARRSN